MITNEEFMTYYKDMISVAWELEGIGEPEEIRHNLEWRNREAIKEVREFTDNLAVEIYYLTGVGSLIS